MGKKRVATVQAEEKQSQAEEARKKTRKKKPRIIDRANIYIKASYNNTMITVANEKGDVMAWATAGSTGFRGPRKATPYAATRVIEVILEKLGSAELKEVHLYVSGIGAGRDSSVRALTSRGLNIVSIKDITPLPHGGPRPRKRRRV